MELKFVCILVIVIIFMSSSAVHGGQYDTQVKTLFSTTQTGDGTYYDYSSGGSCTLDSTPILKYVDNTAAIDSPYYYGSATCGMCLQLTGDGTGSGADPIDGTFTIFVNNLCPECAAGDLDLAGGKDGRWDIEWIAIPCPGNYGNIQYMGQGSNSYYIKLQVRNHKVPVSDLAIQQSGSYVSLSRTSDNFFISSGNINYPLSDTINIQVTSIFGEVLYDQIKLSDVTSGNSFNSPLGIQFESSDYSTATVSESSVSTVTVSESPVSVSISTATVSESTFSSYYTTILSTFTSLLSSSSLFTSLVSSSSLQTSVLSSSSDGISLSNYYSLVAMFVSLFLF